MNEPSSFTYNAKIRSELFSISRVDLASLALSFTHEGREQLAEALLEEFFKHAISRNVAIGLASNGINFKSQMLGMSVAERAALRMQRGYYVNVLSKLSGEESPPLDEMMPTLFGKPLASRHVRRQEAERMRNGTSLGKTTDESEDSPVTLISGSLMDAKARYDQETMNAIAARFRTIRQNNLEAKRRRVEQQSMQQSEAAAVLSAITQQGGDGGAVDAAGASGDPCGSSSSADQPSPAMSDGSVAAGSGTVDGVAVGAAAGAAAGAAMVRVERSLDAAMARVEMLMERIVDRLDTQEAKLIQVEAQLGAIADIQPVRARVHRPAARQTTF